MNQFLLKTELNHENDIVVARRRTRDFCNYLQLDKQDQTRVATAVSEMARNVFQYAKSGTIDYNFAIEKDKGWIVIIIKDQGPGIPHLDDILSGLYVSPEGMGIGILGSKKLMDDFHIKSDSQGTIVTLKKVVPLRKYPLTAKEIKEVLDVLVIQSQITPLQEIQKQNEEILLTIAELNQKKEELSRLNMELEQTNRGVVALYAELDEKAESLRIANETKTSFLSDMTHEFRSPVNSILSISKILLQESVAEGNKEREKQINFIIKAGQGLSDLVNDLLDIAKIEAGKIPVNVSTFSIDDVFSTLKGLMRPININPYVQLIFEDVSHDLKLKTDEGKINQMLRNLISNALKYTEKGEIRVMVRSVPGTDLIEFQVKDTGIGIPEENLDMIFNEFVQVENPLQKKNKGTGLGLSLTKKLAILLGGSIEVVSKVNEGSVFIVRIPSLYEGASEVKYAADSPKKVIKQKSVSKLLIVDDDEHTRTTIKSIAEKMDLSTRIARDGKEGLEIAKTWRPDLIILDLVMPVMGGMEFIKRIMLEENLRHVPIVLNTSQDLSPEEYLYLEQVTDIVVKKDEHNASIIEKILRDVMSDKRQV